MAFTVQLYQTPPPPLGRESGAETTCDRNCDSSVVPYILLIEAFVIGIKKRNR